MYASSWQMGFSLEFKGLMYDSSWQMGFSLEFKGLMTINYAW
jgi:hypothetical protein